MTRRFKALFLGCGMALIAGCGFGNSESFTFTADLPPDFTYQALAQYVPAKGETCTAKKPHVGYNQRWRQDYKETYKLDTKFPIYRTTEGCQLVIYRIELDIYGSYGEDRGNFGKYSAAVAIREHFDEKTKGVFDTSGTSTFNGQCQWLFRTVGPKRYIRKLLDCKNIDNLGMITKGRPVGAYTLDQLPGKTVKLKIKLADEEIPGWGDTWVKVPNGWKRCIGEGLEDQRGYCNGNYKDFSSFLMPDGRSCTIYPGCTE